MVDPQLRVGVLVPVLWVDVGCQTHRVGIAGPDGVILEEFMITHSQGGFRKFFDRIEHHRRELSLPVAMECYNGHARPSERMVQAQGYRLYNVNNLKLNRFKQIFPGAAKTVRLDTRKILELFHLKDHLPLLQCYELPLPGGDQQQ